MFEHGSREIAGGGSRRPHLARSGGWVAAWPETERRLPSRGKWLIAKHCLKRQTFR